MRIRTKLFLTMTIIVALFLGCLTFYILKSYSQFVLDKLSERSSYSISQLSQNVDNLLQSYEQITDFIYVNSDIQRKMLDRYDRFEDAQATYEEALKPFTRYISGSRLILRLTFHTDNLTFQFPDVRLITNEVMQAAWYETMTRRKLNNYWSTEGEDPYYGLPVMRLTQRLNNYKPDANLFVSLDLDKRIIYDLIAKESKETRFIVFLPGGEVLIDSYHRNSAGGKMKATEPNLYEEIVHSASGSRLYIDSHQSYLLTYQTMDSRSSTRGMKVLSLHPVDELTAKVNEMKRLAIILSIIFLLLFSAVIFGISYGLTKRLMVLATKMNHMNMDNLRTLTEVKGKDEVSQLARTYNRMVTRMDRLIHEAYDAAIQRKELELKTKESELYALQTQINPHYLFNVLNAIRGNLLEKGDRENAQFVNLLARSFRNLLGKSGHMISLSEEIEIVETYLKIQSFRFMERMAYSIHIPESLHKTQVPRLLVQTLIENAVVHGVEKSEICTTIRISAQLEDPQCFILTVADDGPGISADKLADIVRSLDKGSDMADSRHIGLRNVQDRIQRNYGPAYRLHIESSIETGTIVTIRLPLNRSEGGDVHVSGIADRR